jgi:hypothetical protein
MERHAHRAVPAGAKLNIPNPFRVRALVMRDATRLSARKAALASSGASVPRTVRRVIILAASLWLVVAAGIVLYVHF